MEFAYLDESGDPGAGGSKKIVMCLVCTRQKKKLNQIIRKTKQRLLNKKKTTDWLNRRGGEIKFYSFPNKDILIKTLKEISKLDLKIYYICFNKEGKKFNLKHKEAIMGSLFWHIIERSNNEKPQKIVSDLDFIGKKPSYFSLDGYNKVKKEMKLEQDKRIDTWQGEVKFGEINYEDYKLSSKTEGKLVVKVEPTNSRISEELQATDLISGSIFQYVEYGNSEYFDIIKSKIVMGSEFSNKK